MAANVSRWTSFPDPVVNGLPDTSTGTPETGVVAASGVTEFTEIAGVPPLSVATPAVIRPIGLADNVFPNVISEVNPPGTATGVEALAFVANAIETAAVAVAGLEIVTEFKNAKLPTAAVLTAESVMAGPNVAAVTPVWSVAVDSVTTLPNVAAVIGAVVGAEIVTVAPNVVVLAAVAPALFDILT